MLAAIPLVLIIWGVMIYRHISAARKAKRQQAELPRKD
jgi:hypothetical protein